MKSAKELSFYGIVIKFLLRIIKFNHIVLLNSTVKGPPKKPKSGKMLLFHSSSSSSKEV